ncbi:hypothetical protein BH10BAC2_BH10BAC2_26370 [soil metagenome]
MKDQYLKFLKKAFILLIILFIGDRLIGSVIEYYFQHEPLGDGAAFSHAINNPQEDILIYGSSKAVHTYDTKVFTDSFKLSSYNCGRNGSNIVYGSALLPAALEGTHQPKLIVLDVAAKEIAWRSNKDGNDVLAGMILPYVLTNPRFEKLAGELFPMELYKARVSKMYAYNSLILSIIRNYSRKGNDNINGFQPLIGSKLAQEPPDFFGRDKIDPYSLSRLEFFAKSVTDKKTPLVVIISPMYSKPFEDNESIKVMKQLFAKYNIQLWDYSRDPKYLKREYFYDVAHLNTTGAEMFSKEIITRIKNENILK